MFTGLIEDVGKVRSLDRHGEQARLVVAARFAAELAVGDSVAINGCCLTATARDESTATFDLLARTLELTSLGQLAPGHPVNLERALAATARLGGHFVQGHVDATGEILDLSPRGQDHRLEVSLPPEVEPYCVDRGSLAVDGISLTIAEVTPSSAVFWIIPHTFAATNLQAASVGRRVNLEADLLAKYAGKLLGRSS